MVKLTCIIYREKRISSIENHNSAQESPAMPQFRVLVALLLSLLMVGCAHLAPTQARPDRSVFLAIEKADQAYAQSRWPEAGKHYREVIAKVPEDHYAWFRLANTQLRQGQLESAIYTYKQAEKRNPRHARTQYNLAMSYLLNALQALQRSGEMLREEDPGKIIVQQKMVELQSVLEGPQEATTSPGQQPLSMH